MRKIESLGDLVALVIIAIFGIIIEFSNSEMTRAQLVINYWSWWLGVIGLCLFISYRISKRG